MGRYPDINLPAKSTVLLIVRVISWVSNNLMHSCVNNLGRLSQDKNSKESIKDCHLQSTIDRVALN